jgi:hypothetical protein
VGQMPKRFMRATFGENSQSGVVLLLCAVAVVALIVVCGFYFGWLSG